MKVVQTKYGALGGVEKGNYSTFFGVPYAQPPVGELRWQPPQPLRPWEGVKDASEFSFRGWQMVQTEPEEGKGINYPREFYSNPDFMPEMNEDCLYLNIWVPENAQGRSLSVAFWIHGGAFINGFGSELEFDGEAFTKNDVILVTINYRLGAFGFLCHPELSDTDGLSGNYGILDQIAALKWVHENISAFGGDPDKITIFGQSAGSMSVQTLLSSPLTKGLISGAILQSAGGYNSGVNRDVLLKDAEEIGILFGEKCGVKTKEELYALSPEEIMQAVGPMMEEGFKRGFGLPFLPVIDGKVLTKGYNKAIEDGDIPDIPYMIGSCGDDMDVTPEMRESGQRGNIYNGCVNWSLKNAELGRKPSYVYCFDRRLPGSNDGAFHSAELWYVFGTVDRCWRPMEDGDYKLSELVNTAWCNFVKSGNPNGKIVSDWLPCSKDNSYVQIFDVGNK